MKMLSPTSSFPSGENCHGFGSGGDYGTCGPSEAPRSIRKSAREETDAAPTGLVSPPPMPRVHFTPSQNENEQISVRFLSPEVSWDLKVDGRCLIRDTDDPY